MIDNRTNYVVWILLTIILIAGLLPAPFALAQTTDFNRNDTIVANPKAARLKIIWKIEGGLAGGDNVGSGAGGLGDIFGTGYGAWAVNFGRALQWRTYTGKAEGLDTESVFTFDSASGAISHPVIGDFFGTGHAAIGYLGFRKGDAFGNFRQWLHIYRTDSNRIADTAAVVWDAWNPGQPDVQLFPDDILAADLDRDGADELIVISSALLRNGQRLTNGEIWIYHGGADFQIDSPMVIITDTDANPYNRLHVSFSHIDDDPYLDMVIGAIYSNKPMLKFFRGLPEYPFIGTQPQRIILRSGTMPDIEYKGGLLDVDGDGRMDFPGTVWLGDTAGVYLWRSGTGKDPWTRPFNRSDADNYYAQTKPWTPPLGYLNDGQRRFQMLGTGSLFLAFSGGPNGPNTSYDAYFSDVNNALNIGSAIFDVNGDGYDDYLMANSNYQIFGPDQGIALIVGGGPDIPFDTATSSIREVAVAGRAAGMHVWPNPVRDELNIAWRGDLKQMPARFEVHDMLGCRVASGTINSWQGAALWQCAGVPAGSYLLSAFDENGVLIASTTIIKE